MSSFQPESIQQILQFLFRHVVHLFPCCKSTGHSHSVWLFSLDFFLFAFCFFFFFLFSFFFFLFSGSVEFDRGCRHSRHGNFSILNTVSPSPAFICCIS